MFILFVCLVPALAAAATTFRAVTWWGSDAGAPHLRASTVDRAVRHHVRAARWIRHHAAATTTGEVLVAVGALLVIGAVCVGVLLAMVRTEQGFARFDGSAARLGAVHATEASTRLLRVITQLGGAVVLVPVGLALGIIESRRSRSWSSLAFVTVVFAGQLALAEAVKAAVSRVRPDLLRLTGFAGPSFPSGHATAAAAAFAAFALLIGRRRSRPVRSALAAAGVGMAVLVAASRVTLGVHWLTDVMAGLALGWTWFAVTSIAFGGRRLRFADPLVIAEAVAEEMDVDDRPAPAGATRPRA